MVQRKENKTGEQNKDLRNRRTYLWKMALTEMSLQISGLDGLCTKY